MTSKNSARCMAGRQGRGTASKAHERVTDQALKGVGQMATCTERGNGRMDEHEGREQSSCKTDSAHSRRMGRANACPSNNAGMRLLEGLAAAASSSGLAASPGAGSAGGTSRPAGGEPGCQGRQPAAQHACSARGSIIRKVEQVKGVLNFGLGCFILVQHVSPSPQMVGHRPRCLVLRLQQAGRRGVD